MPHLSKIINEAEAAENACIACKAARGGNMRHMTAHANAAVRAAANAACMYDALCSKPPIDAVDDMEAAAACVGKAIEAAKEAGRLTMEGIDDACMWNKFKCDTVSLELKAPMPHFDRATVSILIDSLLIAIAWAFCTSNGLLSQ